MKVFGPVTGGVTGPKGIKTMSKIIALHLLSPYSVDNG